MSASKPWLVVSSISSVVVRVYPRACPCLQAGPCLPACPCPHSPVNRALPPHNHHCSEDHPEASSQGRRAHHCRNAHRVAHLESDSWEVSRLVPQGTDVLEGCSWVECPYDSADTLLVLQVRNSAASLLSLLDRLPAHPVHSWVVCP
jgi:hypothetical protein